MSLTTLSNLKAKFCIKTIEKTTYLSIPYDKFLPFFDRHPSWDRLARKTLEINYLDKLERIPQYNLASFIGITPSALNRILKK
ncbi:MAG: hypothetical protein ACOYL6_15505 [Bacteriovoracaceae bacterium]